VPNGDKHGNGRGNEYCQCLLFVQKKHVVTS
jgi:hypothetical protein